MKKRIYFIMAAVLAVVLLAGCGKKGTANDAEPSPTPGKQAVVMTAPPETAVPAGQVYGSMENLLSITLPDGTWLRQEDTYNKMRFQSAGRGDIFVLGADIWDESGIKIPEAASGVRDLLKAVNYVGAYETVSFTRGTAVWTDTFEAELKLTPADVATQYKTCVMYGAQNSDSVVIAVGMLISEDQKDKDMLLASLKTLSKGTEEEISALQTSTSAGQNGGDDSRDSSAGQNEGGGQSSGNDAGDGDEGYNGENGSDSGEDSAGGQSNDSYAGDSGSGSEEDGSGEGYDAGSEGSDEGSGGDSDGGESDSGEGENDGGSSGESGDSSDGAGEDENYE